MAVIFSTDYPLNNWFKLSNLFNPIRPTFEAPFTNPPQPDGTFCL